MTTKFCTVAVLFLLSLTAPAFADEDTPASPTVTAPPGTAAAFKQAGDETMAATTECKNKRLSGELKTRTASAECSNPKIIEAYQNAGYPYMDLIYRLTAKRRERSEKQDKGTLTEGRRQPGALGCVVRRAHSVDRERPFRPIVITESGDH